MFTRFLILLLISIKLFIAAAINPDISAINEKPMHLSAPSITVTYIANEGFLIESENKKVLIDALFGRIEMDWCVTPPREILRKMENAEEPFDDIDLILTTHWHTDHFDPVSVANHLINNPEGTFISSEQTIDRLKQITENYDVISDQIVQLTPGILSSESVAVNGIKVKVYKMHHSKYMEEDEKTGKQKNRHADVENLGFIIDFNGFKVFHPGDENADPDTYKKLRLDKENIDVAFLNRSFLYGLESENIELITKYIKPGLVVAMHIYDDQIKHMETVLTNLPEGFPDTILFKIPLETKVFNK